MASAYTRTTSTGDRLNRDKLREGIEYYEYVMKNVLEMYPELADLDGTPAKVGAMDQDIAGYQEQCEMLGGTWNKDVILGIVLATHTQGIEVNEAHNLMHALDDGSDDYDKQAASAAHSSLVAMVFACACYMVEFLRLLLEDTDGEPGESQGAEAAGEAEGGG